MPQITCEKAHQQATCAQRPSCKIQGKVPRGKSLFVEKKMYAMLNTQSM